MYAVQGDERLVSIEPPLPEADVGAPEPAAAMSNGEILLAYYTAAAEPDPVALVRFSGVVSVMLGAPNDETLASHPLYAQGLAPYEFVEVEASPWLAELQEANSIHPHHQAGEFAQLRHFVLPFHDATFECVAGAFDVLSTKETEPRAALARLLASIERS
jgi:hypothetical protein